MTCHQKNLLAFADFFIPCAPEAQVTHKFVLGATGWRSQPWLRAERQRSSQLYFRNLCLYLLEWEVFTVGPFYCPIDTSTTLPVHCSEFTLWFWDRRGVTNPCVGNSHRKEPVGHLLNPSQYMEKLKKYRKEESNKGRNAFIRDDSLRWALRIKWNLINIFNLSKFSRERILCLLVNFSWRENDQFQQGL